MSNFYLTPVKGDLPLHLLETIVIKRLEFLTSIDKKEDIVYTEYIVEGSVYDTIGHYMLCVIVILENNSELLHFFLNSEKKLFELRLQAFAAYDYRILAKKLLRVIKRHDSHENFLDPLITLCQHLKIKHIAQHVNSIECCENCSLHSIKVHYTHCFSFIAKRLVELNQGIANIPCSKWKTYLTVLFMINLRNKINKTNLDSLKDDPRITDLILKVRKTFMFKDINKITDLKSCEIDNIADLFPPCMLNLHVQLRRKHRLSHDQRFLYSLFLKDIGMPIEEAVSFWRNEYSQAPSGKTQCCHNWKNDENKFIYGIRHLYGLEGGRKSYNFGSCKRVLNSDTSCSEGGCPFKSFDVEAMLNILNIKNTDPFFTQIKNLQKQGQYTTACSLYMQKRFNCNSSNNYDSNNLSPVKYYLCVSQM